MAAPNENDNGSQGEGFRAFPALSDEENRRKEQSQPSVQGTRSAGSMARQLAMEKEIHVRDVQITRMRRAMQAAGIPVEESEDAVKIRSKGDESNPEDSATIIQKATLTETMVETLKVVKDLLIRNGATGGIGEKRKRDDASVLGNKKECKRGKGESNKTAKWCKRCKSSQGGQCSIATISCKKCGKLGHKFEECKSVELVCFICGGLGHISIQCPNPKVLRDVGKKCKCDILRKKDHRRVKKEMGEKLRFCRKCHSTHKGPCTSDTMSCRRCGMLGHKFEDCKSTEPICYNCRLMGHLSSKCPNPKVTMGGKNGGFPRANGRE